MFFEKSFLIKHFAMQAKMLQTNFFIFTVQVAISGNVLSKKIIKLSMDHHLHVEGQTEHR